MVTQLEVSEREEGVVTLHSIEPLTTRSKLEPVSYAI